MKVAIIGGSGKMGQWFASFLLKDGKEVVITGRNEKKLLEAKQQLGIETATRFSPAVRILLAPYFHFVSQKFARSLLIVYLLFAELVTLVYNVYNSYGLGYYTLLIISID